jgi:hypothetical protein
VAIMMSQLGISDEVSREVINDSARTSTNEEHPPKNIAAQQARGLRITIRLSSVIVCQLPGYRKKRNLLRSRLVLLTHILITQCLVAMSCIGRGGARVEHGIQRALPIARVSTDHGTGASTTKTADTDTDTNATVTFALACHQRNG